MRAHPIDEGAAISVLRHIQVGKRWNGGSAPCRTGAMAHIAVHDRRVRPVGLDGDDGEAVLLDQAPRDGGTRAIELGRAMAGFAEQDNAAVGEAIEQAAEGGIVEARAEVRRPPRSSPARCARATGRGRGWSRRAGHPRPNPVRRSAARTRRRQDPPPRTRSRSLRVILSRVWCLPPRRPG